MSIRWGLVARTLHYWGSIICLMPVLIVVMTGTLLLLKKEFDWIQPTTVDRAAGAPAMRFERILEIARSVEPLGVTDWQQVERLDIRPAKGVIKIRAKNRWEAQIDQTTGEVLKVAYRRSDLIESIHDGSFFHPAAKLGIFLPSAVLLLLLSLTGLFLFLQRYLPPRRTIPVRRPA